MKTSSLSGMFPKPPKWHYWIVLPSKDREYLVVQLRKLGRVIHKDSTRTHEYYGEEAKTPARLAKELTILAEGILERRESVRAEHEKRKRQRQEAEMLINQFVGEVS